MSLASMFGEQSMRLSSARDAIALQRFMSQQSESLKVRAHFSSKRLRMTDWVSGILLQALLNERPLSYSRWVTWVPHSFSNISVSSDSTVVLFSGLTSIRSLRLLVVSTHMYFSSSQAHELMREQLKLCTALNFEGRRKHNHTTNNLPPDLIKEHPVITDHAKSLAV